MQVVLAAPVVPAAPAAEEEGEAAAAVEAIEEHFTIQWHITERCNCRCLHCYQEECRDESDQGEIETTRRAISHFLHGRKGVITITGGEPLLHPHFFSLLNSLEHPFGVLTNGTLIDSTTAQRLVESRPAFVQVSIEGREKTHEAIRGKGSYRAAVEGIKNLTRLNQRVIISFTAHSRNLGTYPQWPDWAGVWRWIRFGWTG
ncbi:MAG TPA: radical SAM protein [Syntrophomonadaceae bacterium]|nr:radical SAM protein [Syntrophomonadaceae bacterium]